MINNIKRKIGICLHCGRVRELSDDHVPPQNLFSKPLPNNMITVPSCDECNSGSSKDDEYFRSMITLRYDIADHPEVLKLWPKVWRSFTNPFYGGLRKAVLKNFKEIDIWSKAGIYLGRSGSYEPDEQRVHRVLKRIINGIVYQSLQKRLPNNYERRWFLLTDNKEFELYENKQMLLNTLGLLQKVKRHVIGNKVFIYKISHTDEDIFKTIGLMLFYEKVLFLFITIPESENKG